MDRKQIIAVALCAVLCAGIYLFADTKKPKTSSSTPIATQPEGGHAQPEPETLDIANYIAGISSELTDSVKKEEIVKYTNSNSYQELLNLYQKMDKPLAVAYYAVKLAESKNTAIAWVNAGDYSAMLLETAPDEKAKNYLISNSLHCYQQAVSRDSANTDYRVRLAGAYMENGSQPMQGVTILLDIVRKDSTNVPAQLMLGRFGIISGQFDKAIARLEKILYLQPQNSEAMLLLAEAYNGQGNKPKAIEMLERCKKTVTNPGTRKQLEESIRKLKQPNS